MADQILVNEGDQVKAGQVLMKLDTETERKPQQPEKAIKLKQQQLTLKEEEKRNTMNMNQEEVVMLENNLALQTEILGRCEQLKAIGAFSEVQYLNRQTSLLKPAETYAEQGEATASALLDQQTAQLRSNSLISMGASWRAGSPFANSWGPCGWCGLRSQAHLQRLRPIHPNGYEGGTYGFTRSEGRSAKSQDWFRQCPRVVHRTGMLAEC